MFCRCREITCPQSCSLTTAVVTHPLLGSGSAYHRTVSVFCVELDGDKPRILNHGILAETTQITQYMNTFSFKILQLRWVVTVICILWQYKRVELKFCTPKPRKLQCVFSIILLLSLYCMWTEILGAGRCVQLRPLRSKGSRRWMLMWHSPAQVTGLHDRNTLPATTSFVRVEKPQTHKIQYKLLSTSPRTN
jgi:hypothetical protein